MHDPAHTNTCPLTPCHTHTETTRLLSSQPPPCFCLGFCHRNRGQSSKDLEEEREKPRVTSALQEQNVTELGVEVLKLRKDHEEDPRVVPEDVSGERLSRLEVARVLREQVL